jgi:hypothetical protein
MDTTPGKKYTTSFIPRKAVAVPNTPYVKSGGPNLLSLIAFFIFFGAILTAGGVYAWKIQTERSIDSQIASLKKARDEFDEKTIAAATRLNDRINAVKKLLDEHKAPSQVFEVLQKVTLETVRLRNLTYITAVDGTVNIKASGTANGFESVVLQSDQLGVTGLFKDVLFSEVQSAGQNLVTFSLTANLDPKSVLYRKKFDSLSSVTGPTTQ